MYTYAHIYTVDVEREREAHTREVKVKLSSTKERGHSYKMSNETKEEELGSPKFLGLTLENKGSGSSTAINVRRTWGERRRMRDRNSER